MHDLVVILVAISIHCISDYMSEHPRYECPEICEVDHIHLKKIPVLPELDSFTNIIKEEEDE